MPQDVNLKANGVYVDASNPLPVSGTLAAGTANIGDVDVLTLPAGTVAGSSSLPAGTALIGKIENNPGTPDIRTVTTATSATQFATVTTSWVMFKSRVANTGLSYIGDANDVTASNGFELSPGENSGWVPATNLNLFWHFSTNATDKIDVWMKV